MWWCAIELDNDMRLPIFNQCNCKLNQHLESYLVLWVERVCKRKQKLAKQSTLKIFLFLNEFSKHIPGYFEYSEKSWTDILILSVSNKILNVWLKSTKNTIELSVAFFMYFHFKIGQEFWDTLYWDINLDV